MHNYRDWGGQINAQTSGQNSQTGANRVPRVRKRHKSYKKTTLSCIQQLRQTFNLTLQLYSWSRTCRLKTSVTASKTPTSTVKGIHGNNSDPWNRALDRTCKSLRESPTRVQQQQWHTWPWQPEGQEKISILSAERDSQLTALTRPDTVRLLKSFVDADQ